jgi:hypothetical protein
MLHSTIGCFLCFLYFPSYFITTFLPVCWLSLHSAYQSDWHFPPYVTFSLHMLLGHCCYTVRLSCHWFLQCGAGGVHTLMSNMAGHYAGPWSMMETTPLSPPVIFLHPCAFVALRPLSCGWLVMFSPQPNSVSPHLLNECTLCLLCRSLIGPFLIFMPANYMTYSL